MGPRDRDFTNREAAGTITERGDRIDASLTVHYGREVPDQTAIAQNISEGGLFIHTNDVFPVGVALVLRIEFPRLAVERRGQVTWAIQVPERQRHQMVCGMGVHFTDTDARWITFFRNWRRSLERTAADSGA